MFVRSPSDLHITQSFAVHDQQIASHSPSNLHNIDPFIHEATEKRGFHTFLSSSLVEAVACCTTWCSRLSHDGRRLFWSLTCEKSRFVRLCVHTSSFHDLTIDLTSFYSDISDWLKCYDIMKYFCLHSSIGKSAVTVSNSGTALNWSCTDDLASVSESTSHCDIPKTYAR